MEQGEYLYIIGLGDEEDWQVGHGSIYYIEDKNGEKAMPVFTTPERADSFIQVNFGSPEAHIQMLESIGATHAPPLTEGRFVIMPLDYERVAKAAVMAEAAYLVRDPRPDDQQEIIRVPK